MKKLYLSPTAKYIQINSSSLLVISGGDSGVSGDHAESKSGNYGFVGGMDNEDFSEDSAE